MNFVAIDFETANYARDSACAVGLVKVVGGEIVDKAVQLDQAADERVRVHLYPWVDME